MRVDRSVRENDFNRRRCLPCSPAFLIAAGNLQVFLFAEAEVCLDRINGRNRHQRLRIAGPYQIAYPGICDSRNSRDGSRNSSPIQIELRLPEHRLLCADLSLGGSISLDSIVAVLLAFDFLLEEPNFTILG